MSAAAKNTGAAAAMTRAPGHRRRKSRMKLEIDELPSVTLDVVSPPPTPSVVDALEASTPEWPHESLLRNAVVTLLQETNHDDSAFAYLRQVCKETLTRRHRASIHSPSANDSMRGLGIATARKSTVMSSAASECDDATPAGKTLLTAPKSPQERLLALVPNALEKSKSKYQRRPSSNTAPLEEASRWQRLDPNDSEAPITDLAVMFTGDTVPDGFTKLERSPSGVRADLNKGGRGVFVYLCHSRDRTGDRLPISEIIAIFPERGEFVPTDYEVVQRRGAPANLNTGTQGEKIYLCYKRSATSSITDVMVLFPKKGEKPSFGYMKVDRTPDGHVADLNMNSGGTEICLCYKKTLSALSELHTAWLNAALSARRSSDASSTTVVLSDAPVGKRTPTPKSAKAAKPSKRASSTATTGKATEVRETRPASPAAVAIAAASPGTPHSPIASFTWQQTQAFYLYPLLLACYTRHGAAADAALQGLSQCVDAGVFDADSSSVDDATAAVTPGSCRLEVVVDAVASMCHQGVKSRFALALPFFRKVVRKSPRGFAPAVLHAVLKSVIFIGDVDASLVKAVEEELIDNIMQRYDASIHYHNSNAAVAIAATTNAPRGMHAIARDFVEHLVDDVTTGVEIAKMTERMLGIFKSHASIHSPTFSSDMAAAMNDCISSTAERNALQLVITLSKAVHRKVIHAISDHGAAERDHALIVNSLRALNVALLAASAGTKQQRVFGHVVRRFAFTTLNSIVLLWSTDVFRAALTLVSTLWHQYRRHLKVELALLFEHVFLRLLRSSAACAMHRQLDIMHELTPWIQLPHNVVEIFVNFDLDRVQQWKICESLVSSLCYIAEGGISYYHHHSAHAASSNNNASEIGSGNSSNSSDDTALHLQEQAIYAILAIARSVMDASGHAHLISRDARTRHLSIETGGWEHDDCDGGGTNAPALDVPLLLSPPSSTSISIASHDTTKAASISPPPSTLPITRPSKFGNISVRMRNEVQKRNQQFLKRAMEIASSKSLKKAIEYLVAMNFVNDSPRDITSFLRIYHDFFDEAEIGDYLGEGDEDFKVQVRLSYVRAISFKGMTLVESLRHFLTTGGFRLPGEAQKIERMVEAFAQCYWDDASSAASTSAASTKTFASADTAMILAYSIIMLNTDLHNPQVKKNKMSREQFVKNNRGIDSGRDVPKRFLEDIYDDIAHTPMQIKGARFVVASPTSKSRETSSFEIENEKLRVALAKSVAQFDELLNDLSASYHTFHFVGVDTCISPDLIKLLFERVWFYLLALSTSILCDTQSDLSMTMHCLDLLRFNISTCLFLDMPVERQAFCNLLFKVQSALDESAAVAAEDDARESERKGSTVGGSSSSSDLVAEPALTSASSPRPSPSSSSPFVPAPGLTPAPTPAPAPVDETHQWIASIENAAAADDPWRVMGDIHLLVNKMKATIQRQQRSEELNSVAKRISRSHLYIKSTTQFIREGDLVKKCRSRNQLYRFFLFSDQLLYADRSMSGSWNPHNSLRLKLTRVADVTDNVLHKHAFQIHNPEKSFVVYADSAYAKAEWMRQIEDAIAETAQKVKNNARRLSVQLQPTAALSLSVAAAVGAPESSSSSNATTTYVSPPQSPSSSVVASASSAMKGLMRRSSRLSSPTNSSASGAEFLTPTTAADAPAHASDAGSARVDASRQSSETAHHVLSIHVDSRDDRVAESIEQQQQLLQPSSPS